MFHAFSDCKALPAQLYPPQLHAFNLALMGYHRILSGVRGFNYLEIHLNIWVQIYSLCIVDEWYCVQHVCMVLR